MTSIFFIEDLSPEDISLLTQLLANTIPTQSPTSWLRDQATAISNLPSRLLRPTTLVPRLMLKLPSSKTRSAVLCPTHKPLNPILIHHMFLQISAESTIRLSRLVNSPELAKHPMPKTVSKFIKRIQSVNSLWMSKHVFEAAFPSHAGMDRCKTVESGCEACILSIIGGNRQFLVDLRTAMLGRQKKTKTWNPVLWSFVDGWIKWTGEGDQIREESSRIGKEVRRYRRILQLTRRGIELPEKYQKRRGSVETIEEVEARDETPTGEGEEYDLENEIIEHYRTLLSTSTLALPLLNPESNSFPSAIHPSFRSSLTYDAITGTFEPRSQTHPRQTSSIYSIPNSTFSLPPRPKNPIPPISPIQSRPRPTSSIYSIRNSTLSQPANSTHTNPTHTNPKKVKENPFAFLENQSRTTISSQLTVNSEIRGKINDRREKSYKKLVGMSSVDELGDGVRDLLTLKFSEEDGGRRRRTRREI